MNLIKTVGVLALALYGCSQASKSEIRDLHDHGNPGAGQVGFSGAEADDFMDALLTAGVKLNDDYLQVLHLDCGIPVVPDAKPICTLTNYDQSYLNPREQTAAILYQTLLKHGGEVKTGGRLGVQKPAAADKIYCSRVKDRQPQTSCLFFVGNR